MHVSRLALALFLVALCPFPALRAQCEPQVVPVANNALNDNVGHAVAVDGDLMLLGAPSYEGSSERGYVEVYERVNGSWVHEIRLYAPAPHDYGGNLFGTDIDLDGTFALIGAPGLSGGNGGAFLFYRTSPGQWFTTAPYFLATGIGAIRLGAAVSLDDQVVALGAPGSDFGGTDAGKVMIFDLVAGTYPTAQVFAAAPQAGAEFGSGVLLEGNRLFAGAPGQGTAGVVHAFTGASAIWTLEDELHHSNPAGTSSSFGYHLNWLSEPFGGDLWVAASGDDVGAASSAGAVHRFGYTPPVFPQTQGDFWHAETVTSDQPVPNGGFGFGFDAQGGAFSGGRLLAGSLDADGHAYVLRRGFSSSTWDLERKFVHPATNSRMTSAAIDGETAVFGAPWAGNGVELVGDAVHVELDCVPSCTPDLPVPDADPGEQVGRSVAVSGNLAAVGVPLDSTATAVAGAVQLFRHDGLCWYHEDTLHDPFASPGDRFGWSVAIAPGGDHVAVGVPFANGGGVDEGKVVVFERTGTSGWQYLDTLRAPVPVDHAWFGFSLDVDARTVVGAPGPASTPGTAYVFDPPGLGSIVFQAELPSLTGAPGWYGYDVACYGTRVLVGDPLDDTKGFDAGMVAVYDVDNGSQAWQNLQWYFGPARPGYHFGSAVDVHFGVAVVGSPAATVGGQPRAGLAHVFPTSSTGLVSPGVALSSTLGAAEENFGAAVSVDGNRFAVGAPADGTGAAGTVHEYVHLLGLPLLMGVHAPVGAAPNGALGHAVAVSGLHLLGGAPGAGADSGSAWMLEDPENPEFLVEAHPAAGSPAFGSPLK